MTLLARSLPRSVWQSAVKLYESPLLAIGENVQPGVSLCFFRFAVGSTHSCRFTGGGFVPCYSYLIDSLNPQRPGRNCGMSSALTAVAAASTEAARKNRLRVAMA